MCVYVDPFEKASVHAVIYVQYFTEGRRIDTQAARSRLLVFASDITILLTTDWGVIFLRGLVYL